MLRECAQVRASVCGEHNEYLESYVGQMLLNLILYHQ